MFSLSQMSDSPICSDLLPFQKVRCLRPESFLKSSSHPWLVLYPWVGDIMAYFAEHPHEYMLFITYLTIRAYNLNKNCM